MKTSETYKFSYMFLDTECSRTLYTLLIIHWYSSRQIQSQTSQDGIRKQSRIPNLSPQAIKHLWIRTALTEKVLDKIVLYLVENSGLRICFTPNSLHIRIIVLHCLDNCKCFVAVNSMREKLC